MRTIQELADTTSSHNTDLLVKRWLERIVDAAQKKFFFTQFVQQFDLPPGTKDLVVPYRYGYLATMSDTTTEGTPMTWTTMDNLKGVTFTPTIHGYGIAISNHALRINAVNLIQAARAELANYLGDTVDLAVATAVSNATETTTVSKGAQVIWGGDATTTTSLEVGDVLTTGMVAKGKRYLTSVSAFTPTGFKSAEAKSPWFPEPASPFVLFIRPEQEELFLTDSQFINAAEYGSGEVVANGEIGKYLGIRVITSNNLTTATDWAVGEDTAGTTCIMMKANAAGGLAWGQRPRLRVFEFPSELEQRLILETAYIAQPVHSDAIVKLKVLDA